MAGIILSPAQSSTLSQDVYALTKLKSLDLAINFLDRKYRGRIQFTPDNLLKGKTGGPGFIKCRTAFGFCLIGTKELEGNAFFIFRGTQYLADWLTNLNVMTSKSCYHQTVHDGFNQAFKSMKPQLIQFISTLSKHNITTIHCIGHSLGGALATLCGEWIKFSQNIKPYIYTYGSPRVGLQGFSHMCTSSIGSDRIFRVYHKTDVVPYTPIWPYIHTPDSGTEYYLFSPGVFPGAKYHDMGEYVTSVRKHSWSSLSAFKPEKKTDAGIAHWLKQKGPVGASITVLDWLNDAILFVIKKCVSSAQWIMEKAMSSSATIMDRIAYILSHGATLEENISVWVVYLIRKIMSFLGQALDCSQQDINRQFVIKVFTQLQQKLNSIAQNALSQALVDSRAI
jgi:triacylglycerol lipase